MTNRRRLVIWANRLPACHTISALFLMRWVTMGMLSTLETLTADSGTRPRCGFARGYKTGADGMLNSHPQYS